MKYVVIFEENENDCSAYVPDLPGCIAADDTIEEVKMEQNIVSSMIITKRRALKSLRAFYRLPARHTAHLSGIAS